MTPDPTSRSVTRQVSTRSYTVDRFGVMRPAYDVTGMTLPVQCAHCGRVYDLGTVTVTARYLDCSVWRSPCCDLTVDDRGDTGWKSKKDYYRIDRATGEVSYR